MSRRGVLAVLERAAGSVRFIGQLTDDFAGAVHGYHLTQDEYAALASGDIRWIEEHCGKLDERLRTWLDCRLQQEIWSVAHPVLERAEEEQPAEGTYVDHLLIP